MKLVADEGVDSAIVDRLRRDGHQVVYIAEFEPGLDDEHVLALATEDEALLITPDKDSGELVFRLRRVTSGVVLVRLVGLPAAPWWRLAAGGPAVDLERVQRAVGPERDHLAVEAGSWEPIPPALRRRPYRRSPAAVSSRNRRSGSLPASSAARR